MVDKVIVTLVCQDMEFDMEFPAKVQLGHLKPIIALALESRGLYLSDSFQLRSRGGQLKETDTLLEAGVWDGSYLEVV